MGPTCRRPLERCFGRPPVSKKRFGLAACERVVAAYCSNWHVGPRRVDRARSAGRKGSRDQTGSRIRRPRSANAEGHQSHHSAQDEQQWRRRGGEDAVGLPQVHQGPARRRQAQLRRRLPRSAHLRPSALFPPLQSHLQSNVANPTAGGTAILV